MPKNKVSEWSATASNNTDISGINIAEGCAPSGINNAIRELMAQVKDMQTGADGDGLVVGGALTVSGNTILSAVVASGAATFSSSVVMSGTVSLNGTTNIGENTTSSTIISGSATMTTDAKLYLDDAATTASSPALTWDGDTNTGIYRPSADTLAIVTGGTDRLRVSSSGVIIVGSGEGTTSVSGNILRAPDASGTNISGSDLVITAGNGTGTQGSGNIAFKTAPSGSSGSSANSMTQRLLITKNGGFSFGSGSTSYGAAGQVLKSNGDAPPSFGSPLTPKTAWNYSTNVTEIEFADIPAGTKKITIAISGISTNSTGDILIQLADSGGYELTGYSGSVSTGGGTSETMSTGFKIVNSNAAASLYSGIVTLVNLDSNLWVESGVLGIAAGGNRYSGGSKLLSDTLTSLRFYIDGTQVFDAGSINILCE